MADVRTIEHEHRGCLYSAVLRLGDRWLCTKCGAAGHLVAQPTTDQHEPWECACGEMTTVTHWRHGADGAMFHAGPDAPPSDPCPPQNFAGEDR